MVRRKALTGRTAPVGHPPVVCSQLSAGEEFLGKQRWWKGRERCSWIGEPVRLGRGTEVAALAVDILFPILRLKVLHKLL